MTEIQFFAGIGILSIVSVLFCIVLGIVLTPITIVKINGKTVTKRSSFGDKINCDSRPISKASINYKTGHIYLFSPDKMWEHSYMLFRVRNISIHINSGIITPYITQKDYSIKGFYLYNSIPCLGFMFGIDLDIYLNSEKELEIIDKE